MKIFSEKRLFAVKLLSAGLFLWAVLFVGGGGFTSAAAIYKYVDKNGVVHFTDRFESIPKEYRNQIQTIRERVKPEPAEKPPAKKEEETKGPEAGKPGAATVSPQQKQADEQARQAKEAQEKKERAREEKMKRIEALREEIEARQKEIQELRTTWMVQDRNKLLRLNEEITDLRKEIEVLQAELAEEK